MWNVVSQQLNRLNKGPIPQDVQVLLAKHKYHLIGNHSAVKRCLWVKKKLLGEGACYKEKFYGIQSHRCIQMTPAVVFCSHQCVFCWRIQPGDSKNTWAENTLDESVSDDPNWIVDKAIDTHKRILSGFNPVAHAKVDSKLYEEALDPKHAAISLSGEPTIYPHIDGLIDALHKRGLTSYLVTNGSRPKVLTNITEPSQLYISVPAPTEKLFQRICRPSTDAKWSTFLETIQLVPSFKCPTVFRLTLMKHLNLSAVDAFADLINLVKPTFVEPKAYVHVGWSQRRLNFNNMPTHEEIQKFGHELAERTGYHVSDESPISRVLLLTREPRS